MLEELKASLGPLRTDLEGLRKQAHVEDAWANLPRTMLWQVIEDDLKDGMNRAMKAAIEKEATDTEMRSDAAEARVFGRLLARPEKAVLALEGITKSINAAEAEIRRIENMTKGA